jgi:hypothetical protein
LVGPSIPRRVDGRRDREYDREGQQQVLRLSFDSVRESVKQ